MKKILCCSCGEKSREYGLLILRLVVGIVFIAHGWQKLSGGIEGVGGFFGVLGIPAAGFFAYVVTFVELLGGIALVLGFLTSVASGLLAITMIVALFVVHLPNGFSVGNGGYEFVLTLLAAAIALSFTGPGAFSLDSKCTRNKPNEEK